MASTNPALIGVTLMLDDHRVARCWRSAVIALTLLLPISLARAEAKKTEKPARSLEQGQHIFSCGHSFHYFVPPILADMAKAAGISDHQALGLSSIGGS